MGYIWGSPGKYLRDGLSLILAAEVGDVVENAFEGAPQAAKQRDQRYKERHRQAVVVLHQACEERREKVQRMMTEDEYFKDDSEDEVDSDGDDSDDYYDDDEGADGD